MTVISHIWYHCVISHISLWYHTKDCDITWPKVPDGQWPHARARASDNRDVLNGNPAWVIFVGLGPPAVTAYNWNISWCGIFQIYTVTDYRGSRCPGPAGPGTAAEAARLGTQWPAVAKGDGVGLGFRDSPSRPGTRPKFRLFRAAVPDA